MSNKGKGVISQVTARKKRDGGDAWMISIGGVEYWDSKGAFKDKQGQEVEFEWFPSKDDANFKFIVSTSAPKAYGGAGGGAPRGKSKEEIEASMKTMLFAYAKDQVDCIITAIEPSTAKAADLAGLGWADVAEYKRSAASILTARTFKEFLKEIGS